MRRQTGWVLLLALLVVAAYVGFAALETDPGFPLDDGWIHQTYARNLAENGRMEFVPGVVSAGSTSPLWTVLLALGYVLRVPYLWWAFALGALSLVLLAWAGMALWATLWPQQSDRQWLVGVALVLTWPLVWAAASGMETLLFAALGLVIVAEFVRGGAGGETAVAFTYRRAAGLGLLTGLLILTRPDGVVVALLVAAGLALLPGSLAQRGGRLLAFGGLALLALLPYFVFNFRASGTIWPNTFYAKQAEYGVLLAQPLLGRVVRLLYFSLGGAAEGWQGSSGAHLLLLPGVIVAGWQALQADWAQRRLLRTLPLLWAGGHVVLYAWRLPVVYQHGRYLLAAVPVWVIFGLAGWVWLLLPRLRWQRWLPLLQRVALLSFLLVAGIFWLLGAQAYATDVAFINNEMVAVAEWLDVNTPPDALIAAHDIGAIGYFAERPLLDLAGLVSPEVIPFIADEAALAVYIQTQQADYLVSAPGWGYTAVVDRLDLRPIYSTSYEWTRLQGLNNMTVYPVPKP